MATCQKCKRREAIWALQYIASDEPTFARLGYHYRGFRVTKVCDECFQQINDDYQDSLTEKDNLVAELTAQLAECNKSLAGHVWAYNVPDDDIGGDNE